MHGAPSFDRATVITAVREALTGRVALAGRKVGRYSIHAILEAWVG